MNYAAAWKFLDNLQFFKIKLGLDSMTLFMERLGRPQSDLPCIHIAGTNGKGSVAATLRTILSKAGYKVGVYTSPHLSSVRERFRINDTFISQDDFARHATRIIEVLGRDQITYFEFTTALAFLWFAEQQVDFVLLEVGMGGRLDATNIVTPLVSIITNIAMDHEAYLGTTLAEIAAEKAGIIKAGIPVVSGVTEPAAAVIRRVAAAVQAPLFTLGVDFAMLQELGGKLTYQGLAITCPCLSLGLRGGYQADNTALALAGLELLGEKALAVNEEVVRGALPEVRWPGRLEFFPDCSFQGKARSVLLDGAHNPAGVESLKSALGSDFGYDQLIMVWASMGDKDFHSCVGTIAPLCQRLIFTRPESARSATPAQLLLTIPESAREQCLTSSSVEKALVLAYDLAGPNDLICVAGSLYLVGQARAILVGDLVVD